MRDICLSISRMSCMLFRARGRAGSRVRIVRIAARCPRAKSRVFVRRRILFARRLRVVDIPSRVRAAHLVHVSRISRVSITRAARRHRVIVNCFRL
jgi:hypothetical protein